MTQDSPPPQTTLPAASVIELADLLTELDEFLRSGSIIAQELASFLARRGHSHPRFAVGNLIDELSFTALHLRNLTDGIPWATTEPAHLPGHLGEEWHPGS